MQLAVKKKKPAVMETIFDVTYLGTIFVSAVLLAATSEQGSERWSFGLMAFLLVIGDAFHLVPRILSMWSRSDRDYTAMLGIGKLITSITMTIFYVALWDIGAGRYPSLAPSYSTALISILAALRVLLCLFPQNKWASKNPPLSWAIWRNIPFFILGMMVMALFAAGSRAFGGFDFLWLAVLISFAFYLPVVLFSQRNPKIGMLMLPKSCAYAAIVLMGFSLPGI